jgi:hypothetical protein
VFDHQTSRISQVRLMRVSEAAVVAVAVAALFASAAYAVGVHRVRYSPPHAHKAPAAAHPAAATTKP